MYQFFVVFYIKCFNKVFVVKDVILTRFRSNLFCEELRDNQLVKLSKTRAECGKSLAYYVYKSHYKTTYAYICEKENRVSHFKRCKCFYGKNEYE